MNKLTTAVLILIIVALSVLLLVKSCKEPENVQPKQSTHNVELKQGTPDTTTKSAKSEYLVLPKNAYAITMLNGKIIKYEIRNSKPIGNPEIKVPESGSLVYSSETVIPIDTIIYLKEGGTIMLFSEDIKAKGLEVSADIPCKEIHSVDTLKITDSVYISCDIKWYEKPLFVSSITAVVVTGLEVLLNKK